MLSELTLLLISLLSFFLPTQLAFHFNNFQNTVYGFSIDYLIPTLYLTDIIALLIIFFGINKLRFSSAMKFNYKYILYLIFVVINIYVSNYQIASIYKWIKITEMILLGIVIFNTKKFELFKHFVKPLSYSIIICCILGIWQYLTNGSIGGLFYLLGERSFIFNNPNVAPYPYSTFSHPNSFAGFLIVTAIYILQFKNKFNIKYFWFLTLFVATNLILTNSLNVYVTILILLFLRFRSNWSFAFLSFDFSQRFVTHRIELIQSAFKIIKENFWFGVGLNNFIPNLVKVSNTFLNSWELQPVHNIFLLVFSETGIFGLIAFISLFININLPLLAILLTGLNDHYWLTLQQNLLLFTYVVIISRKQRI